MYQGLLEIVTSLGSPRVAVIGDLMLDMYMFGQAERISPEAPVPVLNLQGSQSRPGGAAAVAMDVAALGAKCICMGIVGDDVNGRSLVELLQKTGIQTDGVITCTDRPTTTKIRLVGLAQHRHQQQLFRIDDESTKPIDQEVAGRILEDCSKAIDQVKAICLSDYGKGLLGDWLAQQVIRIAGEFKVPVIVDPHASTFKHYVKATCLVPNRYEAGAFASIPISKVEDCKEVARRLIDQLQLQAVVIKLDKDGAYLHTCGGIDRHIPTNVRRVYDVTGAGDQVLACLGVARAAGVDWVQAVQLANIAAGIEVSRFGVCYVTIDEILQEILPIRPQMRLGQQKILPLRQLLREVDCRRRIGYKIVFTNGCFDLLHRGHIEYLTFCRQQGDLLVVGLNSDESVRQIKGPDRPVNSQQDRAALLAALEAVDFVTIFDELTPMALIEAIRPDVLVKGKDWQDKGVVGADLVTSYGGKVVFGTLVEGKSTTATIEQIRAIGR